MPPKIYRRTAAIEFAKRAADRGTAERNRVLTGTPKGRAAATACVYHMQCTLRDGLDRLGVSLDGLDRSDEIMRRYLPATREVERAVAAMKREHPWYESVLEMVLVELGMESLGARSRSSMGSPIPACSRSAALQKLLHAGTVAYAEWKTAEHGPTSAKRTASHQDMSDAEKREEPAQSERVARKLRPRNRDAGLRSLGRVSTKATTQAPRTSGDQTSSSRQARRRARGPAPDGWIWQSDACDDYGVAASTLDSWHHNECFREGTREKDPDLGLIRFEISELERQLRRHGKLAK